MTKSNPPIVDAFEGRDGQYYVHIKRSGRVILVSEGYPKGNAIRRARSLHALIPGSVLYIDGVEMG